MPAGRCCLDAFAVKRGGYLELQDATAREFPVQNRDPDLCYAVRPFVSSGHLLLLGHAVADDLVNRGLGDAATDRQALAMPSAVVDQRVRIFRQVSGHSVQLPSQRVEFAPRSSQQPTVQCLDPLRRLAALAMPDQPLGVGDFSLHRLPFIESIILLPNSERCATWNFIAMWDHSRIRARAS